MSRFTGQKPAIWQKFNSTPAFGICVDTAQLVIDGATEIAVAYDKIQVLDIDGNGTIEAIDFLGHPHGTGQIERPFPNRKEPSKDRWGTEYSLSSPEI